MLICLVRFMIVWFKFTKKHNWDNPTAPCKPINPFTGVVWLDRKDAWFWYETGLSQYSFHLCRMFEWLHGLWLEAIMNLHHMCKKRTNTSRQFVSKTVFSPRFKMRHIDTRDPEEPIYTEWWGQHTDGSYYIRTSVHAMQEKATSYVTRGGGVEWSAQQINPFIMCHT